MIISSVAAPVLVELTQQLHRFFHCLDERRYDGVLDLFTDDCRWLRQGRWLEGKAAVRAALKDRPAAFDTRHVISNAFVTDHAQDAQGARAVLEAYMTAYRYPAASAADAAPPCVSGPLRFNLTTTEFRRLPDQDWRIAEQRMVTAFAFTQ